MGRGMGKLQRQIMEAIERLSDREGYPPLRQHLADELGIDGSKGSRGPALTRALKGLVERGFLKAAGPGYYIQVKTLDGQKAAWRWEVVDE